jgi:DNA helicase-2/ATP-dependent DNA helicase PcrA
MNTSREHVIEGLNPKQKEALLYNDGPLLILAGAGSGKTKVITHKFSYLTKTKKIPKDSIFTVTFTNKAANEMKERITSLLGNATNGAWIGTFHSQCNRILRKEIKVIGYNSNFSIYDDDDQCTLVRHILKEFKIHEALYRGVASRISSLKSSLTGPEEFISKADGFGFDEKLAKVYVRYQDELRRSNALDFDDMIMLTVKLFRDNKQLLEKYQQLFSYILVDEFQDTNPAQYALLKLLASAHKRICVVGDDDQSIYRFRGAEVKNILGFEKDFPGAKLIKLEQNYRSTQNILNVSGSIISKNTSRKNKRLWTERGSGEKVCYCKFHTYDEESKYIARVIKDMYLKGRYNYRDCAVFYRINLQSRGVEDALRDEGIPYRILGGISFYHRKEIKDVVAYIRLAVNPEDNVSFRRVINCPPRGIGAATLSRIDQDAKKKSLSLFEMVRQYLRTDSFTPVLKEKVADFVRTIDGFSSSKASSASEMIKHIYEKSGYSEILEEEKAKHVEELISSAEGLDIKEFIDRVSLFTNMDETVSGEYVSLLTLHSAKGLEFPVVFITGLEEGLLPYYKAMNSEDDISEERRLFYVGMTRARDALWLTCSRKRRLYTKTQYQEPSRFLKDIPLHCCRHIEKATSSQLSESAFLEIKLTPSRVFSLYCAGCRVKHPCWGIGVVRDCCGDGDEQKITVNFPNIGVKRLAVKFANLERI